MVGEQDCVLPYRRRRGGICRKMTKGTKKLLCHFVKSAHCLCRPKVLKFYTRKEVACQSNGKEFIMATKIAVLKNMQPVMGSSYFTFTMARFYAGLFAVPQKRFCPISN